MAVSDTLAVQAFGLLKAGKRIILKVRDHEMFEASELKYETRSERTDLNILKATIFPAPEPGGVTQTIFYQTDLLGVAEANPGETGCS